MKDLQEPQGCRAVAEIEADCSFDPGGQCAAAREESRSGEPKVL